MQRPSIESIRLEIKVKKDRLRDEMAMALLVPLSKEYNDNEGANKALCKRAYEIAEQMLKERDNYL